MSESPGVEPHDHTLDPVEDLVTPGRHVPFHGRTVSWVEVGLMLVGFMVGGTGLITGPTWWLVWTGGAVVALGGILGLATGIFNDWY
jgi:hypothetical protein